jgi:hypothetical protein
MATTALPILDVALVCFSRITNGRGPLILADEPDRESFAQSSIEEISCDSFPVSCVCSS